MFSCANPEIGVPWVFLVFFRSFLDVPKISSSATATNLRSGYSYPRLNLPPSVITSPSTGSLSALSEYMAVTPLSLKSDASLCALVLDDDIRIMRYFCFFHELISDINVSKELLYDAILLELIL